MKELSDSGGHENVLFLHDSLGTLNHTILFIVLFIITSRNQALLDRRDGVSRWRSSRSSSFSPKS